MGEPSADRDERGYFVKGHSKPGPGNPHSKAVNRFRSYLLGHVTEAHIKLAFDAMVKGIEERDAKMIVLFLQYTCGKPQEVTEDEGSGKEFRIRVIDGDEGTPDAGG